VRQSSECSTLERYWFQVAEAVVVLTTPSAAAARHLTAALELLLEKSLWQPPSPVCVPLLRCLGPALFAHSFIQFVHSYHIIRSLVCNEYTCWTFSGLCDAGGATAPIAAME
jgi:hypothetical protein